jgi:endonuclease G
VRDLNEQKKILETYVICGPIFYFDKPVKFIGKEDNNEVAIPIPNAFFKLVLTENNRGHLNMWSFILPNKQARQPLEKFQVATTKVEQYAGIQLWARLEGSKIDVEKKKIRKMW